MHVLVTFALPAEFAPWRDRHGFRRRLSSPPEAPLQPGGDQVYEGLVGECRVHVLLTGVGCRGSRFALHHALQGDCDLCVSAGLAGGLRDGFRIGDVVAARRAVALGTKASVASNTSLLTVAGICGAKTANVSLTSDALAVTSAQKRQLAPLGEIVEMESYHVLRAAQAARVPAVVLRAISDTVDEDLPMNFDPLMDAQGELSVRKLLGRLARDPRKIPELARFGKKSRRAADALAEFLDRCVGRFPSPLDDVKSMSLREAAR